MTHTTRTLLEEKRDLRKRILCLRDALDPQIRMAWSREICRRVADSPEFDNARVMLLFASFGSEVDTRGLLQEACARGRRLVLPRVDRDRHRLELREVLSPKDDLAPGVWGIPEPIADRCPEVGLKEIDFVLVPGVAFDRCLRRLGYGGGYYDGLLASLPARTSAVAVCFGMQIVLKVPSDENDVRVPVLITESERIDRP